METYDPTKIGAEIAWMGWDTVHRYGENEVIKFPWPELLFGIRAQTRLERDARLGKEYFETYMLDTRVEVSQEGNRIAIVQPFERGRILQRTDLQRPHVREQFAEIDARHKKLLAAGYGGVDLMSGIGFLVGSLRNVFILDNERLVLIDVMLVDVLPRVLQVLAMRRQDAIIASYLR